ncbi:MAG TPA: alpha/beta hydrolase [Candidatus Eisenbacteria bacterium]|nr:alpha/beta hydrolase [Candidatus Eisenbacteria bacterium]
MPWRETPAERGRALAEEAVTFAAPAGRLFGIHTPPDPAAPRADHCVLLLTRPRSHRNRMWVEGARRLAARGFAAFRFDYHGAGDSEGESLFLDPNTPHRDDANAAIRFLAERWGHRRFLVLGACFDARTALSTFADEGARVDGLVFFAAPVMELSTLVRAHADHKDWRHLLRALGNHENWRALGRASRWRYMATVVGRVARRGVPGAGARHDTPLADGFVRDFQALVRARARALFVYGEADAELVSFRVALETLFPRLTAAERARLEVEIWPGDVHGFLNVPMQRRSLERALAWLDGFHPAAAAAANGAAANGAAHPGA